MWLLFLITLTIIFSYYAYMHNSADLKIMPYKLGTDKWGNTEIWTNPFFYKMMLSRFQGIVFTQLGLILLICGLFLYKKNGFFYTWLFSVLLYIFVVAKGNYVHTYYQMPLIPVGSYFIGLVLYNLYKIKYLKVLSLALGALLFYLSLTTIIPYYGLFSYSSYKAAATINQIDDSNSLILAVHGNKAHMPELLYYADRKGWVKRPNELSNETIEYYKGKGVKYVVMTPPYNIDEDFKKYLNEKEPYFGNNFVIVKI